MSGGGLFMTEFTAPAGPGLVAFAAKVPGRIMELDVTPGQGYLIHRHGFLCATVGVELGRRFSALARCGRLRGRRLHHAKADRTCKAWVELGGEVITYDLAPGESLQVHPGHVGMFSESINFDVTLLPGFANMIFGWRRLVRGAAHGPRKSMAAIADAAESRARDLAVSRQRTTANRRANRHRRRHRGLRSGWTLRKQSIAL